MNTRLKKRFMYFKWDLTGLAKRCDWFINGSQILKSKPLPRTIFLSAFRGQAGIQCVHKLLPMLKYPIVLIIASEDYTFPLGIGDKRKNMYCNVQTEIREILENPFVLHVFVENLDTTHPKLSPIPLGILKPNTNVLNETFYDTNTNDRDTLCLVLNRSRNGQGQWADRRKAETLAITEWSDFTRCITEDVTHDVFLNELRRAKFCLCVHGGGYDPCPKMFECILYGAIPIVQHSPLDAAIAIFPVVFIDDLTNDALSKEFLIRKWEELKDWYGPYGPRRHEVLHRLTLDYWWSCITSYLPERDASGSSMWTTIGREGETVLTGVGSFLRYGILNRWLYVHSDKEFITIDNKTFGRDPAPGKKKVLERLKILT